MYVRSFKKKKIDPDGKYITFFVSEIDYKVYKPQYLNILTINITINYS